MASVSAGGSNPSILPRSLPVIPGEEAIKKLVDFGTDMNPAVARAEALEQAGFDLCEIGYDEKSHQYFRAAARIYELAAIYRPSSRYRDEFQQRANKLLDKAAKAREGLLRQELGIAAAPAPSNHAESPVSAAVSKPGAKARFAAPGTAPGTPPVPSIIEDHRLLEQEASKVRLSDGFSLLKSDLDAYLAHDCELRQKIEEANRQGEPEKAKLLSRELKDIWAFARRDPRWAGRYKTKVQRCYTEAAALCERGGAGPAKETNILGSGNDMDAIRADVEDCIQKDNEKRVKWSDVVGLEAIKDKLESAILDPILLSELFSGSEDYSRGILLYGPPGNGKTYLVKALQERLSQAQGTNVTLFIVTGAQVNSRYVGQGEKFVHALFERAREMQPSIIFIDEIETFIPKRGDNQSEATHKVQNQFLQETDGFGDPGNVIVIGATNKPKDLDSAANRRLPSRFYVSNPDAKMRADVLRKKLEKTQCQAIVDLLASPELDRLAADFMEGFSCSDINKVVNAAYMEGPVRRLKQASHFVFQDGLIFPAKADDPGAIEASYFNLDKGSALYARCPMLLQDLAKATDDMTPSTTAAELVEFENFQQELHAAKRRKYPQQIAGNADAASIPISTQVTLEENSASAPE